MNAIDFSGYVASAIVLTSLVVAATIVSAVAALAARPDVLGGDGARATRAAAAVVVSAFVAALAATTLFREQAALLGLVYIAAAAVAGYALVMRTETGRRLLDAVPQSWLIGAQAYRVVGGVFFVAAAQGALPAYFAIPAGAGDFVVGIVAPLVALWWAVGARLARPAAWAWNAFGVLDLIVAVGIGSSLLAAPAASVFGGSPEWLDRAALGFQPLAPAIFPIGSPLTLVPTFLVPISVLLHALSLRKLAAERARGVDAAAGAAGTAPPAVAPTA